MHCMNTTWSSNLWLTLHGPDRKKQRADVAQVCPRKFHVLHPAVELMRCRLSLICHFMLRSASPCQIVHVPLVVNLPVSTVSPLLKLPSLLFSGQCPGGAVRHSGETQGQWPVRVGDHRAVGRAGVRGPRVHRCWAPSYQQATVAVILVVFVVGADHVPHPRPLTGRLRAVPAPAGLRWGAAEGAEARPVSAEAGVGRHWRRRRQ